MAGVMLVLVGVQLIVAGLVGELVVRIYHEGGGRPQFHLRPVAPQPDPGPAAGRAAQDRER
jgi:hypothetical protein